MKKISAVIFSIMLLLETFSVVKADDYSAHFTGTGTILYNSNIGYSWNGWFFETLTEEEIGYDKQSDSVIYRYRYYLTQWGPSGSKTRQTAPVQLFVDGSLMGSYDIRYIGYFSNRCQFGGQIDVRVKVGSTHKILIRDDPAYTGNWTTVNWQGNRKYNLAEYMVVFKDIDGTSLKNEIVIKYHDATPPAFPKKENFTYTGWLGDYKNVTSNREIIAQGLGNHPPVINAHDRTIQATETDEEFDYMEGVTATDEEDGDLTNKVTYHGDVITWLVNDYDVRYTVIDGAGERTQKTVTIHVVDKNTPPTITAEDRYFLTDDEITNETLLEKVKAHDEEDGDLSDHVTIAESNVEAGKAGTYKVTYKVIDSRGDSAYASCNIHVENVIDQSKKYVRSISSKYLHTLKSTSIWRINSSLSELLKKSMEKVETKSEWKLTPADVERIKEFNKTHDYSKESNRLFIEKFGYLKKK